MVTANGLGERLDEGRGPFPRVVVEAIGGASKGDGSTKGQGGKQATRDAYGCAARTRQV